jgi:hypothetical protein
MPGMNFRDAYEFDPEIYHYPPAADLAQRLQQAVLRQGSQSDASNQSRPDAGAYGNPGGLLGRLLALQENQSQPVSNSPGSLRSEPRNSNVRRLSSPILGMSSPDVSQLSSQPQEQSYPSYLSSDGGASLGAQRASTPDVQSFKTSQVATEPTQLADASVHMTPVAWRGRGIPIPVPMPPIGPGTIPQIPMPHVPDWLRAYWSLPLLLPSLMSERLGGKGEDENECLKRWYDEYSRCDMFKRPDTNRYRDACRARANDRLRLCYRNGYNPDPEEPDEYGWMDIPKDPATRRN